MPDHPTFPRVVRPGEGDPRLRVRAGMRTDVGVERANNEDSAFVDDGGRYAVLADGMGGAGAGEIASAIAVEEVRAALDGSADTFAAFDGEPSETGRDAVRAAIEQAVLHAHEAVAARAKAEPDKHGMGTTLDLVVVAGGEAFISHVGDGRTYLIRDGKALQITADHTVAAALQRAGALSDAEAANSPLRTVLASAIGLPKMFKVDHGHLELLAGDRLLICTDGLHGYFEDDDLAHRLSIAELGAALAGLIEDAKARGGKDNITGIVLDVFSTHAGPVAGVPEEAIESMLDDSLAEGSWPLSPEELRPRKL
jgi:serine/threonine protein phosphatase PrpC